MNFPSNITLNTMPVCFVTRIRPFALKEPYYLVLVNESELEIEGDHISFD